MLTRLIYSSENQLGNRMIGDLNEILDVSMRNIEKFGITGALLFDTLWFVQILEGDREAVSTTLRRIIDDERHAPSDRDGCASGGATAVRQLVDGTFIFTPRYVRALPKARHRRTARPTPHQRRSGARACGRPRGERSRQAPCDARSVGDPGGVIAAKSSESLTSQEACQKRPGASRAKKESADRRHKGVMFNVKSIRSWRNIESEPDGKPPAASLFLLPA